MWLSSEDNGTDSYLGLIATHHTSRLKSLLFGIDLKSPTEACFLPPDSLDPTDLSSYREELILSLSAAREMAVASVKEAQKNYKKQYDKKSTVIDYKLGDWVFVHLPEEETGKKRKISRPWYGPFRVVARRDPNFPEDTPIDSECAQAQTLYQLDFIGTGPGVGVQDVHLTGYRECWQ